LKNNVFFFKVLFFSEWNIMDHISDKHKLVWCCPQCCVIGVSNSLVTMQLIEGSIQMEYLLSLLDLHNYFPSQIIWIYYWQITTLCTRLIIASACDWTEVVVTCSWLDFNAIIVFYTHFLELIFEFSSNTIFMNWCCR
jgi:hypothetical protein